MEDDYYSIDAILAENQKIQCTFKQGIPNMGHLEGGNERDVRCCLRCRWMLTRLLPSDFLGSARDESTDLHLARTYFVFLVSRFRVLDFRSRADHCRQGLCRFNTASGLRRTRQACVGCRGNQCQVVKSRWSRRAVVWLRETDSERVRPIFCQPVQDH